MSQYRVHTNGTTKAILSELPLIEKDIVLRTGITFQDSDERTLKDLYIRLNLPPPKISQVSEPASFPPKAA